MLLLLLMMVRTQMIGQCVNARKQLKQKNEAGSYNSFSVVY